MAGLLLGLLPVWIWLYEVARLRLKKGKALEDSDLAVLASEGDHTERTTTVEFPDPTSIEFEAMFADLLADALSEEDRHLVLVVDNLDRVSSQHATRIWSTLQTFLQDHDLRKRPWFSRLWVLVPFDVQGIPRLLPDGRNTAPKDVESQVESLLDKSYQVRFDVPPLVLRDWRRYLLNLLREALPDHAEEERERVYNVVNVFGESGRVVRTPRALKQFVNRLGTLIRQWGAEFPTEAYAYYCVLRRAGTDVLRGLQNLDLPTKEFARAYETVTSSHLAGLAFNVEPSVGIELLLGPMIGERLEGEETDGLVKLADHYSGFWTVLQSVAATFLLDLAGPALATAASALDELNSTHPLLEHSQGVEVRRLLARAAAQQQKWFAGDSAEADGIAKLCQLCSDERITQRLLDSLRRGIAALGKAGSEKPEPAEIFNRVFPLLSSADQMGHASALSKPLTVPLEASEWEDMAVAMVSKDPGGALWRMIEPSCGSKAIVQELSGSLASRPPHDRDRSVLQTLADRKSVPWPTLVSAVEGRLQAQATTNPNEYSAFLEFLHELAEFEPTKANAALDGLADPGHLMHHLVAAGQKNSVTTIAWVLFCYASRRPGLEAPAVVAQSAAGHQELEKTLREVDARRAEAFVNVLAAQGALDLLLEVAKARGKVDPFVAECLRLTAKGAAAGSLFTAAVFRESNETLLQVLREGVREDGEDLYSELIARLVMETNLTPEVCQGEFVPSLSPLYLAMLDAEGSDSDALERWCADGLQGLDKAAWVNALSKRPAVIELLLRLQGTDGQGPRLKTALMDALVDHASEIASSGTPPPEAIRDRWGDLRGCLDDDVRPRLGWRLWQSVLPGTGPISGVFIDLYGEDVVQAAKNASAGARVGLVVRVLEHLSVRGLAWLLRILDADGVVLQESDDKSAWAEIVDRLPHHINEAEFADQIRALAKRLSLDAVLPRDEEDEPEESDGGGPADD